MIRPEAVLMLLLGGCVGMFFFGGLWLTVQRLPQITRPALLMLASVLVRGTTLALAIWWAAGHGAKNVLLLLAGILLARWIVMLWSERGRKTLRGATTETSETGDRAAFRGNLSAPLHLKTGGDPR